MFERVAILGVGLIGGSFGMAVRQRGLAREVVGYSRTPAAREQAVALGAADRAAETPAACVAGADLVYLATPLDSLLPTLAQVAPHLAPGCVVTDAGSSKAGIVAGAAALPLGSATFVGGHPMAGKELMGVEHACPDLFVGRCYAFTPAPHGDAAALARLVALAEALGARPLVLEPAAHDDAVAAVSHLPHVLAYALLLQMHGRARRGAPVWELAAGSFDSATRVAASGPALWREILIANREAVVAAIGEFQDTLSLLTELLQHAEGEALQTLLEEAQTLKADLAQRGLS